MVHIAKFHRVSHLLVDLDRVDFNLGVPTSSRYGTLYGWGWWLVDLGWVDFDLNAPPCCPPAAQPIQPNSHLLKHNWAGRGMAYIKVN